MKLISFKLKFTKKEKKESFQKRFVWWHQAECFLGTVSVNRLNSPILI